VKDKKKKRKAKPPREKTILDTNVIFSGIGLRNRIQKKAISVAKRKDIHVYTGTVDDELKAYRGDRSIHRLLAIFRRSNKEKMIRIEHTDDDLKKYPVKGNDKKIMNEASKTGTKTIVTLDKKFIKKGDGTEGMKVLGPRDYIESKKRRKRKDK